MPAHGGNECVPFLYRAASLGRFFRPLALLVATFGASALAAPAATIDDVNRLADVGAMTLALRVLDAEQPAFAERPVAWQRWERRRLAILEALGEWQALSDRVDGYPAALPDDFRVTAAEAAIRARLALGHGPAATALVAELVWGDTQDTAMVDERSERLMGWRRLLGEAYLLAGRIGDAQTSELRYRLDYGGSPAGWRVAHAKALMREGDDAAARELLLGLETTEVEYMKLLLRARNLTADPVELLVEMTPFLGEGRLLAPERAQLWAALAGVAARYRDHEVRVVAMEQAIALRGPMPAADRLVPVDPNALWDAYGDYAMALANEAHLLVGRFDAWMSLADSFSASGDVRARALYGFLSAQIRDADIAARARAGLVAALAGEARGLRILGALYLESDRYADVSRIPADLRAPLIAYCVEAARHDVAQTLLAGVDGGIRAGLAPAWRGPLAVTLVAAGRTDDAVAMFDEALLADAAAVDGAVQAALALQTAGAAAESAALLARVLVAAPLGPTERRELLYLAAEAEGEAGQHARAARLYLESAAAPEGGPPDAWSRAARLGAVRALARAGLREDALGVLEASLRDSPGPDERVFVEHRLRRF